MKEAIKELIIFVILSLIVATVSSILSQLLNVPAFTAGWWAGFMTLLIWKLLPTQPSQK